MARKRSISTDISLDERVNMLAVDHGDFAALLYTWMIPHAEDDGCIRATANKLLYMVAPMRRDKTPADISDALDGMESLGLIEPGWSSGVISFPAEAFYRYQTYIKPERRRGAEKRAPSIDSTGDSENVGEIPRSSEKNPALHLHSHSHSHLPSGDSVSHETARSRGRKETESEPYQVWSAGCEIARVSEQDAADTKPRQCGKIKQLLKRYARDDLVMCFAWLHDDRFEVDRGIDWFRVEQRIDAWVNKGKPPPRRIQNESRAEYREVAPGSGKYAYVDR